MIFERLFARDSNAGTVVDVASDAVTVATARGTVTARRVGATAYQAGDRVRLANGQVVGRLRAASKAVRI